MLNIHQLIAKLDKLQLQIRPTVSPRWPHPGLPPAGRMGVECALCPGHLQECRPVLLHDDDNDDDDGNETVMQLLIVTTICGQYY